MKKTLLARIRREIVRVTYKLWLQIRRLVMPPAYKVRLIFAARAPGALNWQTDSHTWHLPGGETAILKARGVDSLAAATEFHIDVGGFADREAATETGEKLRAALRLANAVLGLGLHVSPQGQETPRAKLAPHVKDEVAEKHGVKIVDCVFGLNVLKEAEEFELATKGRVSSRPQSSNYVLESVCSLWGYARTLDTPSNLACELLNTASRDTSPRSAFMIAFLALDVLLERKDRGVEAQTVIENLRAVVDHSALAPAEKSNLHGFLGGWQRTSLKSEIDRFVALGSNDVQVIEGERLGDFLAACLKLRNKLAHPPKNADATAGDEELMRRARGVRQVAMNIVWARNKLPDFRVQRPPDTVQIDEMKLSIL